MMGSGDVRIKPLELKDDKAFWGEQTLDLGGKNLLLLGENGSGKTSLMRARGGTGREPQPGQIRAEHFCA